MIEVGLIEIVYKVVLVSGCISTWAHSLHCTLAAALAIASGSASNAGRRI